MLNRSPLRILADLLLIAAAVVLIFICVDKWAGADAEADGETLEQQLSNLETRFVSHVKSQVVFEEQVEGDIDRLQSDVTKLDQHVDAALKTWGDSYASFTERLAALEAALEPQTEWSFNLALDHTNGVDRGVYHHLGDFHEGVYKIVTKATLGGEQAFPVHCTIWHWSPRLGGRGVTLKRTCSDDGAIVVAVKGSQSLAEQHKEATGHEYGLIQTGHVEATFEMAVRNHQADKWTVTVTRLGGLDYLDEDEETDDE